MTRLLEFLTGAKESGARCVALELAWRSPWSIPVVLFLFLAGFLFILWRLSRETARGGTGRLVFLAAFRFLVLGLLALVLAQPVSRMTFQRDRRPTLALLLDTSASMGLSDTGSLDTEAGPDAGEPARKARWARVLEAFKPSTKVLDRLISDYDVEILSVDSEAAVQTHLGISEDGDQIFYAINLLQPIGVRSRLGNGLADVRHLLHGKVLSDIVVVSDGRSTGGANAITVSRELGSLGFPVHTLSVGSTELRDLRIDPVLVERYAFVNYPLRFEVAVSGRGFESADVPVVLTCNGSEEDRATVRLREAVEEIRVVLQMTPKEIGTLECRVQVPPQPGEAIPDNNAQTFTLDVIDTPLRVLLVENLPRWEYRYLEVALRRDPRVSPSFVLFSADAAAIKGDTSFLRALPLDRETLFDYDLIILGDFPVSMLTPEQRTWLREYVIEEGGAILFLAGAQSLLPFDGTPLETLLPVTLDQRAGATSQAPPKRGYRPRLTALGRSHPLLRLFTDDGDSAVWDSLPEMYWYAPVRSVRPGATVLVEHPFASMESRGSKPVPLMVFHYVGRGSTLYLGLDETFRWRYRTGNLHFYRFWGQAVQFLGMPHLLGRSDLVHFETPPVVSAGEGFEMAVRVLSEDGTPVEEDTQTVVAKAEGRPPVETVLQRVPSQSGLYRGRLMLPFQGRYTLTVKERPDAGSEELSVQESPLELRNPDANPALLRRMAQTSGGLYLPLAEIADLPDRLKPKPLTEQWVVEGGLWDKPWILFVLTALLGIEWVVRRIWKMV